MVVVCRRAQNIPEKHHPHCHPVACDPTDAALVFRYIGAARAIGTEIAAYAPLAEGAPLIRACAEALRLVTVPDVAHAVSFDPFVYLPY